MLKSDKGRYVRWDFRIEMNDNKMLIIEYNGAQHYKPVSFRSCKTEEEVEVKWERQKYLDKKRL
jgi:hypothetical protein